MFQQVVFLFEEMEENDDCESGEGHQKDTNQSKNKEANKHECLVCFRLFPTAARLKRHSIVHSTEKRIFQCQFCELSFRLHKELIAHESTHKRTIENINLKRCKICGIACYNDNLLAHLKEYHEHFECDICSKVYRTKNHLKLHMTTHINAREFKCSSCPKAFNFFSQLKRHERSHSTLAVWYCEICGVGLKTKPNLVHHMRSHNGEKPYQCDRCERCFSAKQSLRLHIRIHNGEKPYKCPWDECGRCFNDLATMKVHTRQHTNENPYKCHLCGKTTKQASNLKSHYLHAHKIKDITSKTIRSNARLFKKYKTENLPEAGLLEILSQQVMENLEKQQNEINVAIKRELALNQATIEKFQVNEEMDTIQSQSESKKLVEESKSLIVNGEQSSNVISDEFDIVNTSNSNSSKSNAAIEIKNIFDLEDFPNEAVTYNLSCDNVTESIRVKEEVYDTPFENIPYANVETDISKPEIHKIRRKDRHQPKCDIEKIFVDEQHFSILATDFDMAHEIVKEEEQIDEFQIIKIEDNDDFSDSTPNQNLSEQFLGRTPSSSSTFNSNMGEMLENSQKRTKDKFRMCEICGKIYTSSALKKHLKYTHSDFRPFPCGLCSRAFKDATGLKVHLRSHSGEKPYSCSFCPKSFSTSMGRNLHQRSHTGEKPYSCPYCESTFSDNSTYRQHIRVHTGEKPYVCHLCGKGTTQAGNLKSHLRHAHKIEMKNVTMKRSCDIKFSLSMN